MKEQRAAVITALVLIAAGISATAYRHRMIRRMQMDHGDALWRVRYEVRIPAGKPGAKARIGTPENTGHCRLLRQEFTHPGLRADMTQGRYSGKYKLRISCVDDGPATLVADFDLHFSPQAKWETPGHDGELGADHRAYYLRPTTLIQADSPVVLDKLDELRQNKARKKQAIVAAIYSYVSTQIAAGGAHAPHGAAGAISQGVASPEGQVRAMVALCRAAKIPARLVTGFDIRETASVSLLHWTEVRLDRKWVAFDPVSGFGTQLPPTYMPAIRNADRLAAVDEDIQNAEVTVSIEPIEKVPGLVIRRKNRPVDVLNLRRLPLGMRETIALLLLLPLGALITAVLGSIVGLRTFGTFTPTLLALSFIYADWQTGLVVLAAAMVLGFSGRMLLDWLKLLMVPRLGLILTLVVLCMIFAVSALDYMSLTPSSRVVLLPMVIITMLVERFFVAVEEDSWAAAGKLAGQTAIVATCCFLIMRWKRLGVLLLTYPEIHLISIGVFVLIGRYTGYRLTELWRFRDFIRPNGNGGGPPQCD